MEAKVHPMFRAASLRSLRAYVFVHSALHGLQKGIQGGHALLDMAVRYRDWKGEKAIGEQFWAWMTDHKTVVFCDGGFTDGIRNWHDFIFHRHHQYPRSFFREDGATLGGLMTAVAIVLPDYIYEAASSLRKGEPDFSLTEFNQYDQELIQRLVGVRLAS